MQGMAYSTWTYLGISLVDQWDQLLGKKIKCLGITNVIDKSTDSKDIIRQIKYMLECWILLVCSGPKGVFSTLFRYCLPSATAKLFLLFDSIEAQKDSCSSKNECPSFDGFGG